MPATRARPDQESEEIKQEPVQISEMEAKIEALLREVRQPKLPQYDSANLDLWFRRVETEFAASGMVNDDSKYYAVLRALDGPATEEITDVMDNPPTQDKYKFLKNKIIERLGTSAKEKLQQVIKGLPLEGKKPSQLLREMRKMSAGSLSDDALHGLWVEKLPSGLKAFLAMSDDLNLDQLAKMADRIIPEINQESGVMSVAEGSHKDTSLPLLTSL